MIFYIMQTSFVFPEGAQGVWGYIIQSDKYL